MGVAENGNGYRSARASRHTDEDKGVKSARPSRQTEEDQGVRSVRPSRYTEEEAQTVDKAKRIHKETTASAQRALKTANRTKELAANTLEELERQGDKLEAIDNDLHAIDADVKESKGLLNYMQRCCLCFLCSCCCDCDPSVQEDKNRKHRVRQAREDRNEFRGIMKQNRETTNGMPADMKEPEGEEATRNQLFQTKAQAQNGLKAKRDKNSAFEIGKDLEEPDRQEILKETQTQEKTLDAIGDALDDMRRMGQGMNTELQQQADVLERVNNHVDSTQQGLANVQASAEKTLGKKGTKKVNRKYMPSQMKVASALAKY